MEGVAEEVGHVLDRAQLRHGMVSRGIRGAEVGDLQCRRVEAVQRGDDFHQVLKGRVRLPVATGVLELAATADALQQHRPQFGVPRVDRRYRNLGRSQCGEHGGIPCRPATAAHVAEQEQLERSAVALDVDGPRLTTRPGEMPVGVDDRSSHARLDPRSQLLGQATVGHQRNAVIVVWAAVTSASLVTMTVGLLSMSMKVWRSAQCARPASVSS